MTHTSYYDSPLGGILLASDGESLTGLWFAGQKYYGDTLGGEAADSPDLPLWGAVGEWLGAYFAGRKPGIGDLPLAPNGSAFRWSVWEELLAIPYGEVATYGDIAERIGCKSAQAVGGAVGHNPISIIIPCHRVVGQNGSLTGYAGGLDRKRKLLELEGADMSRLFAPGKGTAL
ncbi:MAG: methylated-DNA--[protein]-cysteine S-methyltransferase [Clostridiales Family XIII bacterium]|jgi:methylated-DNA-[protein]-cysteine S-methyltransferase|nr:methylated-DNA--[protein]-cysteine S-methyltransferase [Clostridiales Family XIII bacterium]